MDLLPPNVHDNIPAVTDPPVLSDAAQLFAEASMAENTKRTYRIAIKDFAAWCAERNLSPLPANPVTAANYAADLATAGKKASTIKLRMVAIRELHRLAEMPLDTADPTLTQTLRGIWRTIGVAQKGKAPLEIEDLRLVIEALPDPKDCAACAIGRSCCWGGPGRCDGPSWPAWTSTTSTFDEMC